MFLSLMSVSWWSFQSVELVYFIETLLAGTVYSINLCLIYIAHVELIRLCYKRREFRYISYRSKRDK